MVLWTKDPGASSLDHHKKRAVRLFLIADMADASEQAGAAGAVNLDDERNPDGTPLSENQKKKRAAKLEKERKKQETAARVAAEKEKKDASEVDFAAQNYGNLPLNQSQERTKRQYSALTDVTAANDGKDIIFTARIQTARSPSGESRYSIDNVAIS